VNSYTDSSELGAAIIVAQGWQRDPA